MANVMYIYQQRDGNPPISLFYGKRSKVKMFFIGVMVMAQQKNDKDRNFKK